MKCKDCYSCRKGWFRSAPDKYVCIGVKEPFVIDDINVECTEYPENREEGRRNMKSSELLLSLDGESLDVFYNVHGICVRYKGAEIKEGAFLTSVYGTGTDFESACDDYIRQIRGKRLVFDAYSNKRREIMVLG